MSAEDHDRVTDFYDRHPYPPPITDLEPYARTWQDGTRQRVDHHLMWPSIEFRGDHTILVAGCGTSQAAKYAIRYPEARVVGIDVSTTSIEQTQALAERHGLDNVELHVLPISRIGELAMAFDQIVCTGVLHHLADPDEGLRALADVLMTDGALKLMLYAPYGRAGVYMIQDYCQRLGIGTSPAEIDDLVTTLRELPVGHPLSYRLRSTPDFQDPDALADALLHPRDRSYSVPEVFELVRACGLEFGRWVRQAPYLPNCGSLSMVPHGARISALPLEEQYAAVELFRGTMARHSFIAYRSDRVIGSPVSFHGDEWQRYVPIRPDTVIAVEERLPDGAAAALLNRAHECADLVLFVDQNERRMFDAVDGTASLEEIADADPDFFRRLWDHDLVVLDTSATIDEVR
jgi:SAM-dependent methyltransferase